MVSEYKVCTGFQIAYEHTDLVIYHFRKQSVFVVCPFLKQFMSPAKDFSEHILPYLFNML